MQKKQIDEEFNYIYPKLQDIANKMIAKYNRKYEPNEVISIAYLYILDIKKKIVNVDIFKRFIVAKICQEIALTQSYTNRLLYGKEHELPEHINLKAAEYIDPYEEEVVAIEKYRCVKDRVKRRVFEVYYDQNINTCRKMATYFNINTRTSMTLIQEMKKDLKTIKNKL